MNLTDLSTELLGYIVTYGAVVLGVVVLLAAVGVPLPSTFFVVAGGALIEQGTLNLYATFLVALIAVVFGDMLSYGMGRLLRHPVRLRFGRSDPWLRAEAYFQRRGALAIYLTRWLVTPLAVPINLIAGGSDYSVARFIRVDAAGELTWLLGYGGLGYLFGSQWRTVTDFLGNFSGVAVVGAVLGATLVWLWRRPRRPVAPGEVVPPE